MRPAPLAAGLNFCRPGNVSRALNGTSSADARRETESAMPLDVSNLTKSRREVFTSAHSPHALGSPFTGGAKNTSGKRTSQKSSSFVMHITKHVFLKKGRGDRCYTGCVTGALNYHFRADAS